MQIIDIYFMYLDQFIFTNKTFDFCSKTQFKMVCWIVITIVAQFLCLTCIDKIEIDISKIRSILDWFKNGKCTPLLLASLP